MTEYDPKIVEQLALGTLAEARAKRRWNILIRLGWLLLAALAVYLLARGGSSSVGANTEGGGLLTSHTAVVSIDGIIMPESEASAERVNRALKNAFSAAGSKAVLLSLNSGGGSPVQSGQIYSEIKRLRAKHPDKPVYAVVSDLCASGCYYIAAAADKIYADQASIVGSIGVIMESFGVTGLMEKLGVERRVLTAGENKSLLDPFSPQNEKQVQHIRGMLQVVHQQFIKAVRDGRGAALKETPEMFTGLVWSGSEAIKLGLVDELGSLNSVARDVVKVETLHDYTEQESFAERLSRILGSSAGKAAAQTLGQMISWPALPSGSIGGSATQVPR